MIKTPSSTVIGGAFWTPKATILGGTSKTFNQLIKSLFANNEQGFAYDPNDLTTMFQYAAGTVPVTGAGQPVGLILDKSKGLVFGSNTFDDSKVTFSVLAPTRISAGYYNITTPSDNSWLVALENQPIQKWYSVEYEITRIGSGSIRLEHAVGAAIILPTVLGREKVHVYGDRVRFTRSTTPTDVDFKIHSIKELAGNHAYQITSSMRPLLVAAPQKLDYDTVDDKLITNLPAQLTGCTVIRSVPNVGTQILTNQKIPTPYNANTDHCGLIVINRALTPSETSAIAAEFNKRAGV